MLFKDTPSFSFMHTYDIPQPIWRKIGSKTLATTEKLGVKTGEREPATVLQPVT